MMHKLSTFFKTHFAELALLLVSLIIAVANYTPQTTLTGWDNLHPEYNLPLNIERSVSAVWQEYQGVGLLGGMAHAADLPRQIMLIPAVLLLPVSAVRYVSTFFYLLIGPLGAYALLRYLLKENKTAAFVGALFYLLNLATIQTFYVPYESFIAFFGFLPWFLYAMIGFLEKPKGRQTLAVITVFVLGSAAFYVQTLFIVLLIVAALFILNFLITHRKKSIKPVIKLFSTILAVSAFWLLPVVYFTFTNVHVVSQSKINSISTVETEYMNQAFGSLGNIAQLKGFWTNYIDAQGNGYGYLMNNWQNHFNSTVTVASAYILFAIVLVSCAAAYFLRKKIKYPFVFPTLLLLTVLMLSAGSGSLGGIFNFISEKIPLFGQIFRSTFTKWSTVASLTFGWGIGLFIASISSFLKGKKAVVVSGVASVVCMSLMLLTVYPVFHGRLISDNMRLKVPSEYYQLFDFLKTQPKQERIAFLPVQAIWGWNFYDWGYRGSGFLWYGIEQPILDRAFDVWSHENESFYQEFEHVWYKADPKEIALVLSKYQVDTVLLDRSIMVPTAPDKDSLGLKNAESLLSDADYKKIWNEGSLELYQKQKASTSFVNSLINPQKVSSTQCGKEDQAYRHESDYVFDVSGVAYPFSQSTNETLPLRFNTDLFGHEFITATATLPEKVNELTIPTQTGKVSLSGFIEYSDKTITGRFLPAYTVSINNETVFEPTLDPLYIGTNQKYEEVALQFGDKVLHIKQGQTESFSGITIESTKPLTLEVFNASQKSSLSLQKSFTEQMMNTCWERYPGEGIVSQSLQGDILHVSTKNAVGCASYKIGSFAGNKHLLSVSVPFRSPDRARPDFCVVLEGSSTCLHDEVFYNSQTNKDWTSEKRDILVEGGKTYWMVLSARPSDTPDVVWNIEYQAPVVEVMSNIAEFKIEPSFWQSILEPRQFEIPVNKKSVTITAPVSAVNFDPTFSGRGGSYNCDLFKRGSVNRSTDDSTVTFEAEDNGISCDFRLLSNITQTQEYVLRIQGNTTAGRGPKIYLYNEATKRNDLETLISGNSFDQSFSLLPQTPEGLEQKEFTINYETRSFGAVMAKNTISQLSVYPFPLTWLSQWKASTSKEHLTFYTRELYAVKYATFLYGVSSEGVESNDYITLSQGYNPGWVAISSSGVLNHTVLNSWANAWEVSNPSNKTIIIYLPQILEFIGFATLFTIFSAFLWRNRKSR